MVSSSFFRVSHEPRRKLRKTQEKLQNAIIHQKLKEKVFEGKQFMIEAQKNSRKYFTRESIYLRLIEVESSAKVPGGS